MCPVIVQQAYLTCKHIPESVTSCYDITATSSRIHILTLESFQHTSTLYTGLLLSSNGQLPRGMSRLAEHFPALSRWHVRKQQCKSAGHVLRVALVSTSLSGDSQGKTHCSTVLRVVIYYCVGTHGYFLLFRSCWTFCTRTVCTVP